MSVYMGIQVTRQPFHRGSGPHSHRSALVLLGMVCLAGAGSAVIGASADTTPASEPLISPIGQEYVQALSISPAYQKTGTVVAWGEDTNQCKQNCVHLWVTHDGGATWHAAKGDGWKYGHPVVAADSQGHETILAPGDNGLQRSTDGGDTWKDVGAASTGVTLAPTNALDGSAAIAGGKSSDFLWQPAGSRPLQGSNGSLVDISFTYAPGFPSAGPFSPALLSAADKSSGLPVIEKCNAQLVCSGSATLSGSTAYSEPVSLLFSSDYAHDGVVFAQSGVGIYKSIDGGTTFTPVPVATVDGQTQVVTPMMALAPGFSQNGPVRTAYVSLLRVVGSGKTAKASGGVYRTDDAGTTWTDVDPSSVEFGRGATAVGVSPDGRIFAAYLSGLACSTDGKTWQSTCPSTHPASNASTGSGGHAAAGQASGCAAGCSSPAAAAGAGGVSGAGDSGAATGATQPLASAAASSRSEGTSWLRIGGIALILVVFGLGVMGAVVHRIRRGTRA